MNKRLYVVKSLLFVVGLFVVGPVQSQAHFSYEANWPFENQLIAGNFFSKISVAKLERSPNTFDNPANNAFLTKPVIFGNMQIFSYDYTLKNQYDGEEFDIHPILQSVPGNFSVAFPFSFVGKQWAIDASYNGKPGYFLDDLLLHKNQNIFDTNVSKSGTAILFSSAISLRLFKNIAIGFGVNKHVGEIEWKYKYYGETKMDYSSQAANVGINGSLGKFRLATVLHFPYQILEFASAYDNGRVSFDEKTDRKSKGNVLLGISYNPISPLTIGINYGFQPGIEDNIKYTILRSGTREYAKSTILSGGVEYNVQISQILIPIYAGYKMYRNSRDNSPTRLSYFIGLDETKDINGEILLGANLNVSNIVFYLDTKISKNTFKLYDQFLPPWS